MGFLILEKQTSEEVDFLNIILYTQPDCPPCEITKAFLNEHGIQYETKNIKTDSNARNELIDKHQSFSTPTIVIGDKVIAGFNLDELKRTLNL